MRNSRLGDASGWTLVETGIAQTSTNGQEAGGFSLAYGLATAIFVGFTATISTALISATGGKVWPLPVELFHSAAQVCAELAH